MTAEIPYEVIIGLPSYSIIHNVEDGAGVANSLL